MNFTNMMMIGIKDRKDIKPLLVKCCVALAVSFGGMVYTRIKAKRIDPSDPPRSGPPRISDSEKKRDYAGRFKVLDDSQHENPCNKEKCVDSTTTNASTRSRCRGYNNGLLLLELDQLVREFSATPDQNHIVSSPKKDINTFKFNPERYKYGKEIDNLKKQIKSLREQEKNSEAKLLEYSSLKEKETAVRELESRLKIHDIESKLFSMKIESLRADNKRLESQVADFGKVVGELEAAKAKIKFLKRKIRNEAEEHKGRILELTHRVGKMQEQEEVSSCCYSDVHLEIERVKELEMCNRSLQQENADLARRFESNQPVERLILEDPEKEQYEKERLRLSEENSNQSIEIEKLKADRCKDVEELVSSQREQDEKERANLREENLTQSMKIEKLKADRCKDAEELVCLRWMNACLRRELRSCKPQPTNAEDEPSPVDVDSDWAYSQTSYNTDHSSSSQNSLDNNRDKHYTKKKKFLTKLRKLIKGKREANTRDSVFDQSSSPWSGSSPQDSPSHEEDSRDGGSDLDYRPKGKSYARHFV